MSVSKLGRNLPRGQTVMNMEKNKMLRQERRSVIVNNPNLSTAVPKEKAPSLNGARINPLTDGVFKNKLHSSHPPTELKFSYAKRLIQEWI